MSIPPDHERPHREGNCYFCPLEPLRSQESAVWCPCGWETPLEITAATDRPRLLKLRCGNCLHFVRVLSPAARVSGRQKPPPLPED